jgi:hypothetical protein
MVSTSGGNHLEGHGEGDSSRAEDAILGLMTSLTFPFEAYVHWKKLRVQDLIILFVLR